MSGLFIYVKRGRIFSFCVSTLLVAVTLISFPFSAAAQETGQRAYPAKPVRLVIPYVAGGPFDLMGRVLNQKLQPEMTFVIENKPGAGSSVGTDAVAKSPPDGYTMLLTSSTHASLPVLYKTLPYDAVKDFVPVMNIANSVGFLMVAHLGLPARNVQEFVALAKAQPGKFTYGSTGIGNVTHFAAEIFNSRAGTHTVNIPYKGLAQVLPDLFSGRIDISFGSPPAFLPHIRAGKLNAFGITSNNRWSELPEVPTIDEAGVKGVFFAPWYALLFPRGTPDQFVMRMRSGISGALRDPDVMRAFSAAGFLPSADSPSSAEITTTISRDVEIYKVLAAKIGLQPE